MTTDMVRWIRTQLDERQHWNEGTGLVAWLSYLDDNGALLYSRLAATSEFDPEHWTVDGLEPPGGWKHANVIHDERAVREHIAATRAILDLHEHHLTPAVGRSLNQRPSHRLTGPGRWRCSTCHPATSPAPSRDWCQTVRQIARPYHDQPGYREEWRP